MSGSLDDFEPSADRAGEYVLGVIRGMERSAFEAELARDPALAMEVAAWEQRLLPLSLALKPVVPPASVWEGITAAIAPSASASSTRRSTGMAGWLWGNLALWRSIAAAAAVVAAIFAVVRPATAPSEPNLVAVLQSTPAAPATASGVSGAAVSAVAFTVAINANGAMNIAPLSMRIPPKGRAWQVWAIAPKAKPVPIGMLHARSTTHMAAGDVPAALRQPQVLIAVSVEPPGGSPTGLPTGPVVFTGPLLRLQ